MIALIPVLLIFSAISKPSVAAKKLMMGTHFRSLKNSTNQESRGECYERCYEKYDSDNNYRSLCSRQCHYGEDYCEYPSVESCKKAFNPLIYDDDEDGTYKKAWEETCAVSCKKTRTVEIEEEKDCLEGCDDLDGGLPYYACYSTCYGYAGRCPYNSYSDCKKQYDEKKPYFPIRELEGDEEAKLSDYVKEDVWKDYCSAVCPRASVWWVALIVLLVVAIAAVVVLVILLIITKKKASS